MTPLEAGRVIGGKYELVRLLGRGSMGQVWVAHHTSLDEEVALKLLAAPPSIGGEAEHPSTSTARFRFEAQVAARLSRKTRHIVRVTDHGEEDDGLAYLVMELLEGQTLEHRLLQRGALSPLEVAEFVTQMARALEQAHSESIIHRDLKPANVFVTRDEDGRMLVKLLDFGIARAIRTQRVASGFSTGEGLIFGTPGYMSPEQACASRLDTRCDLWALATVAYEALTGQLPVGGACTEELLKNLQAGHLIPVHERNPHVPSGLSVFFEQAFARQIEQRFSSASQLALAFEQAAVPRVGAAVSTSPVSLDPFRQAVRGETLAAVGAPNRKPPSRRRWARLVFMAPATLLGLAVAAVAWRVPASSPAGSGITTASTVGRAPTAEPRRSPAPADSTARDFLPARLASPDEATLVADAPASALARDADPTGSKRAPSAAASGPPAARLVASPQPASPLPIAPAVSQPPPGAALPSARKSIDKSAVL